SADELKLTRIKYAGRLFADNKRHTAIFIDKVETYHAPGDNPNFEPNLEQLTEGAMAMTCERLKVYNRPENGKNNQQMKAKSRVNAWTPDSTAQSDTMTYNEA